MNSGILRRFIFLIGNKPAKGFFKKPRKKPELAKNGTIYDE